jgi:hypothetical protein
VYVLCGNASRGDWRSIVWYISAGDPARDCLAGGGVNPSIHLRHGWSPTIKVAALIALDRTFIVSPGPRCKTRTW